MKKTILIFNFIYIFWCANAQYLNSDGKLVTSEPVQNGFSNLRTEAAISRNISELNIQGKADAYPFLSSDGLRLYYVSDNDLYTATRASVNDVFGGKSALFKTITGTKGYGCWLTSDELTIYYVINGSIYISKRSSVSEKFPEGTTVLSIIGGSIFSGISFTPDMGELYAYKSSGGMCKFNKTGENQYTFQKTLPVPSGFSSLTGQLSKDGLNLYVTLNNVLHVGKRIGLNQDFTDFTPIETGFVTSTQPTVNGDQSIMIFVNSPNDRWDTNELYEINGEFVTGLQSINYVENFNVFYPNPSDNGVYQSDVELKDVKVYNSMGHLIPVIQTNNSLNLSSQPEGVYMAYFKTKNGTFKQKLSLR